MNKRRRNGQFEEGHSGNPGRRPKKFGALVREKTREGEELIDFALKVMRDKGEDTGHRMAAMKWLGERGFGRPALSNEDPSQYEQDEEDVPPPEIFELLRGGWEEPTTP